MQKDSEVPSIIGLVVIGVIAVISVWVGKDGGLQVASAAVGGIAGYLARGRSATAAPQVTNTGPVETQTVNPPATAPTGVPIAA